MKQRTKQEQFEETKTKTQAGRNYKNLFISLQQNYSIKYEFNIDIMIV